MKKTVRHSPVKVKMGKDIKNERHYKRDASLAVKLSTKVSEKQSPNPVLGTVSNNEDSSVTIELDGNVDHVKSATENNEVQCQDEIQSDVNLAEYTGKNNDCLDKNTTSTIQRKVPSLPYPQLSKSWYRRNASTSIINKQTKGTQSLLSSSLEKMEDRYGTLNNTKLSNNMKRKYKRDIEDREKKQKTSKQCDKPSSSPLPHLIYECDALESAKEKVCFPQLSRNWFHRQNLPVGHEQMPDEVPKADQSYGCPFSPSNTTGSKQANVKDRVNNVPFTNLSKKWYRRRGALSLKNCSRTKQLVTSGTIDNNIQLLKDINKNLVTGARKHGENSTMIKIGNYILENGPLVPTQEIGSFLFSKKKNDSHSKRKYRSSEILKRIQRHLNVIQVQIRGKAYLMENKNQDISQMASRLESIVGRSSRQDFNAHIETSIGSLLRRSIRFADTKKDVDLIKGLFASATSVKFVSKMLDVKNRNSIRSAKDEIGFKLSKFEELEKTSQIVRNDLTNEQQRRLTKRIVAQRKKSEFKLQYETRGREMLADIFPELKFVMEEIFNQGSTGMLHGGLESHPRLTTDILYKSSDNTLFMRQARDIILKVAPPGFGMSLKSCYNYTESYKEKTYSAKRHHAGKGVNARISLKCPPRIGVSKHVVNLHWTTKNVNLLMENMETCADDCIIDSKDAKTIVCGDIQPVQYPGKSWKPIVYEDHTFDQSRTNAVYPMTHLFMDTSSKTTTSSGTEEGKTIEVTRNGRAAILVNIALTEHETTFRAMNELLYLVTRPSLDNIFRNPKTGSLKSIFSFIVDNGHGEDPDSPLTQMCMARLLHLLGLNQISQKSFAEYHSKRNFVERVHAAENMALSRHGPFNSKQMHSSAEIGSKEHLENMEKMANDVKDCLSQARFAGNFLQCFRGISENGVFDDEERLKAFLSLSEERKEECEWAYTPRSSCNPYFEALVEVWNVPKDFEGKYITDYNEIMNKGERCSAWKDKYSTTLYGNKSDKNCELQPIPDYVTWFKTNGELHYLSFEKTTKLYEEMAIETPALFLPSRILDFFFFKNNTPPDDILIGIATLVWIPVSDVSKYFQLKSEKMEKDYNNDVGRETWRSHKLYEKSVADLQQQCKASGVSSIGQKHVLVERLALASGEAEKSKFQPTYKGKLSSLPKSMTEIKKFSIPELKYILRSHAVSYAGKKDELVLRLYLLIHGRAHLAFYQQEKELERCIQTAKKIISMQIKESMLEYDDIRRIRTHKTPLAEKSKIPLPVNLKSIIGLHDLFKLLQDYVQLHTFRKDDDDISDKSSPGTSSEREIDEYHRYFEVGTHVKIRWSRDEIGDTGWKAGWYNAEVQESDLTLDEITVVYVSEPESIYKVEVTPLLAHGKLKLL